MYLSQTKQINDGWLISISHYVALTMPLRLSDDLKECIIQWYYIDQMIMEDKRWGTGDHWTKYPPFYIEKQAWHTDLLQMVLDKNHTQDPTVLSRIPDFAPEPFAMRRPPSQIIELKSAREDQLSDEWQAHVGKFKECEELEAGKRTTRAASWLSRLNHGSAPLFGSGTSHVTVFRKVLIFKKLCKAL